MRLYCHAHALILLCSLLVSVLGAQPLAFKAGDVVAFVGGTDMVRMQQEGRLEAALTFRHRDLGLRFRDLAWDGDTVYFQSTVRERWRQEAFGDWDQQLERVGASVVIAQFGKMESLKGLAGLEAFERAYSVFIRKLKGAGRKVVLLGPSPMEWSGVEHVRSLYAKRVQSLAETYQCAWIPCVDDDPVGGFIQGITGKVDMDTSSFQKLQRAVVEKHRLWLAYWRPANWKCLFGDDSRRIFSNATLGLPSFQEEWAQYPALIEWAEKQLFDTVFQAPTRPFPSGSEDADIQKELSAFETLEGFRVELVADESNHIANPLSVRWDARGYMYVACSESYPQIEPGQKPYDTIVRLEDTDGDGRMDASKIFAKDLHIPTGMEVGSDAVFVGQGTELLRLRDLDGDGVADERKLLLSGFGNGDSHQTLNSFVWSPGGELWFCQGDGIESRVETPFGVSTLYQAGVFRLRPATLRLDGLLDDFMGPGNPWGIAFDDFGQSFVIDGAGGISFLTPGSIPVKRRLKLPRIGRPGGYCGIECLGTRALPAAMQGEFLLGDYKKNQVSRFAVQRDGAGFKVLWRDPVLRSRHPNFRPIDVKVGPDGAVYVVDWYNPITCHQDDYFRHPDRDKTHGRIWRVVSGMGTLPVPRLADASSEELIQQLDSPERWTRLKAKQVLASRDPEIILPILLKAMDLSEEVSARNWMEVASLLEWQDMPDAGILSKLKDLPDARARAYAARLMGTWGDRLEHAQAWLELSARDEDPLVRMEAILASASLGGAPAIRIAAIAAASPMDRWIQYAFSQAVVALKPKWLPALKQGLLDLSDYPDGLAAILEETGSEELLGEIRQLLSASLSEDARGVLLRALAVVGNGDDLRWLLDRKIPSASVLEVLKLRSRPIFDVDPVLRRCLADQAVDLQVASLNLIAHWQLVSLRPEVFELAQNGGTLQIRQGAIQALARLGDDVEVMDWLLGLAGNPGSVLRSEAMGACLQAVPLRAVGLVAEWLLESGEKAEVSHLFSMVTRRQGLSAPLATALRERPPDEVHAQFLEDVWLASGLVDEPLSRLMRDWGGRNMAVRPYSVDALEAWIQAGVDAQPQLGKVVFESAHAGCSACHRVQEQGGTIGPDLSSLGISVPRDRIVTEVLWPGMQVKKGYSLSRLTLRHGEVIQGYIQEQRDERWIRLRAFAGEEILTFSRDTVLETELLGSLMPPTARWLPREDLTHLLAYLFQLGTE